MEQHEVEKNSMTISERDSWKEEKAFGFNTYNDTLVPLFESRALNFDLALCPTNFVASLHTHILIAACYCLPLTCYSYHQVSALQTDAVILWISLSAVFYQNMNAIGAETVLPMK